MFVIGGDWEIEHEGMDRKNISLPGDQAMLVQQVRQAVGASVPVVAVMVHGTCCSKSIHLISWGYLLESIWVLNMHGMYGLGGSMDISDVLVDADAVLDAYYPGQFGATAIAGECLQLSVCVPCSSSAKNNFSSGLH